MKEYIMVTSDTGMVTKVKEEIVRCKDCKHILPKGFCHKYSRKVTDDYFCADGERRTNDA